MAKRDDKALLTMDDLVERIRSNLETAWNGVSPDSDEARALADVWTDAQILQMVVTQTEQLLAETISVAEQMRQQRDMAVEDRQFWMNENRNSGLRELAYYLAQQAHIGIDDARRVINMIIGDEDLPVSEYSKQDFIEAVRQLAMELLEETMLLAEAGDDYEHD
jgi:hypothetical protein